MSKSEALPHERLRAVMKKYNRLLDTAGSGKPTPH
jgi:hypothetical protein